MFFCKLEKLEELEKEQDWNGSILYLDLIWKNDKTNTELLLRLASECWFVLTNYEAMNLEKFKVDYKYVQNELIETYHYYSEHGKNNKCDLMFGYFMTISAFVFCKTDSDKDYFEIESTGRKLIENAFKENDCALNQVIFYGSSLNQVRKQARAKSVLKKEINTIFSKDTEIEKYFLDVLTK